MVPPLWRRGARRSVPRDHLALRRVIETRHRAAPVAQRAMFQRPRKRARYLDVESRDRELVVRTDDRREIIFHVAEASTTGPPLSTRVFQERCSFLMARR
jgi:hypothetical protein